MTADLRKRSRRRQPSLEHLEGRVVPVTFGVPWKDPGHLSLSFAPDGTAIVGHASTLSSTLNPRMPTATWQREILRAFQTWAVNANVNIGLVGDGGQPFGTAGPSQHDPRFGDIRVGAQAMSGEVLSISVPNDPSLSSTWTGDVLVNNSDKFGAGGLDLYTVLLHEAGHVFGLADSTDPKSVMNARYNKDGVLTADDLAGFRALYGARSPDANDAASSNDTIGHATPLQFPGGYQGATPLIAYGDITTSRDVDFYALRPMSGYTGSATIRLQSRGISLLTTKLSVVDGRGNVLATTRAASDFGDVVSLTLARVSPDTTYYLKVQGATSDVFGVGDYGLAVTFDGRNTADAASIDRVLRGPYQSLAPNEIADLFLDPDRALFHDDHHTDDGVAEAIRLSTTAGFAANSRFDAIGSLSDAADVDFYRVNATDARNGQPNVMTATVRAIEPNGVAPRLVVLDRDLRPVAARVLANGDGTYTVQAVGMKSGANYYVRVLAGPTGRGVGNYALSVDFGHAAANLETFARTALDPTTDGMEYDLYVAQSQLFQFLLSATAVGQAPGTIVTMTVRDQGGRVLYTLASAANDTTSGQALFLTPGPYKIDITAASAGGLPVPALAVNLQGENISDPIGPTLGDSSLTPIYTSPTIPTIYSYPGGIISTVPFLIHSSGPIRRP